MRRYYHKHHAPDPRKRHPCARSTCYPCAQSLPNIFLSLDGRGLTSPPRTAIRGEGESRRPRLLRPPNKHQLSP